MKEIGRLRIKFMLYNMVVVTAIVITAFFAAGKLIENQIQQESHSLLAQVIREERMPLIFGEASQVRVPYFTVLVGEDGTVALRDGVYNSFSDDRLMEQIAWQGVAGLGETGELEEYHLRYLRVNHPGGYTIAFADTSYEEAVGTSMRNSLFLIGCAIWLCFLALSYFFARWAVRPVEESVRAQKQFVADASHELKTPLTVIMANAELLKERCAGLEADVDKWIHNVHQESLEMKGLVEELLLLARSEGQARERGARELCSLTDVVTEGLLTFEPVFYQSGKTLEYRIGEGIWVKGDSGQLQQLVKILLDNAVKYSRPEGRSQLLLERISKRRIRLMVCSQGEEIPADKRKAVFERFYRMDQSRTGQAGYGLGLAIAKGIARNHRAKIGVEYREGMNCFYVVLHQASHCAMMGRKDDGNRHMDENRK